MRIKNAGSPSDCFKQKKPLNVEAGHRFRRPHKEWRKRQGAIWKAIFLKLPSLSQDSVFNSFTHHPKLHRHIVRLWEGTAHVERQDFCNKRTNVIMQLFMGRAINTTPKLQELWDFAPGNKSPFCSIQEVLGFILHHLPPECQDMAVAWEMLAWCNTHFLVFGHTVMVVTGWVTWETVCILQWNKS